MPTAPLERQHRSGGITVIDEYDVAADAKKRISLRHAQGLVERDPANGSFQKLLVGVLQDEAKGCAKEAGSPEISRARHAELWQRAIAALTRCQEKLDSPQLAQMSRSQLTKQHNEIENALSEARNAYAKIANGAETESPRK